MSRESVIIPDADVVEITEGDTQRFDVYVLHVAQSLRASHPWLAGTMRSVGSLLVKRAMGTDFSMPMTEL